MALTRETQRAWLAQVDEEVVDPAREIVDPHHHLWRGVPGGQLPQYLLEDLLEDRDPVGGCADRIRRCGAEYREGGPDAMRCIGETEFVAASRRERVPRRG